MDRRALLLSGLAVAAAPELARAAHLPPLPGDMVLGAPKAPVHVLVVPKTAAYRDVVELAAGDPALLAEVVDLASRIAAERAGGQFRLLFNTGADAGQTVFHVHAHVLAGFDQGDHVGL